MQQTLVEPERAPDSPIALLQHAPAGQKVMARPRHLRLYLYILRGMLLLTLTLTLFFGGVRIIGQHAKALGFFALNFNVPLPFLLIGLWGIAVLTLAIFTVATFNNVYNQLTQILHPRPAVSQR